MHQRFHGIGCNGSCELFFIGLAPLNYRNRENILQNIRIDVQHHSGSLFRFLRSCMDSVSFLPKKLSRPKKRSRGLLPAHHGTPLIQELRKITVGLYDFRIVVTEKHLGSRTNAETLFQSLGTSGSYPCHLRSKAFYVFTFFLEQGLWNQKRHRTVLYTGCLKPCIQCFLDSLPDGIPGRSDNHEPLHGRIIRKFRLLYYVRIPLRKIYFS